MYMLIIIISRMYEITVVFKFLLFLLIPTRYLLYYVVYLINFDLLYIII